MTKRILIVIFVLLQVADVFTTNSVLAAGGREENPFVAAAISSCGSLWWLPKLGVALACAIILVHGRARYVAAGVALMSVVVLINCINESVLLRL